MTVIVGIKYGINSFFSMVNIKYGVLDDAFTETLDNIIVAFY